MPAVATEAASVEAPDAPAAVIPATEVGTEVARDIGVATGLTGLADVAPHEEAEAFMAAVPPRKAVVAGRADEGPRSAPAVTAPAPGRTGSTAPFGVVQAEVPEARRTAAVAMGVATVADAAAKGVPSVAAATGQVTVQAEGAAAPVAMAIVATAEVVAAGMGLVEAVAPGAGRRTLRPARACRPGAPAVTVAAIGPVAAA